MKDVQFVSADKVKTLEHYAAALVSSMVTLRKLGRFHISNLALEKLKKL